MSRIERAEATSARSTGSPEDAAFFSWWYASHKHEPTERERLMWVCGYVRGRLVGQGFAGEVYEHG